MVGGSFGRAGKVGTALEEELELAVFKLITVSALAELAAPALITIELAAVIGILLELAAG